MTATTEDSEPTDLLTLLAADAEYWKPRLFAIYGLTRRTGAPFLGWGMDMPGNQGAVFWNPDTNITHLSPSAEQVLNSHRHTTEAHLKWLD